MTQPDIQNAIRYARERMSHELPSHLTYHHLGHTFDDVLPAALRFAAMSNVDAEEMDLLSVAAAFHDIGWIVQGDGHEAIGVEIVHRILPSFGFTSEQIQKISGMIMATRVPQEPQNLLEEILVDADLDVLGRDDFWPRNHDLRTELAARGVVMSDLEWYLSQFNFMEEHSYFTAAAETLRGSAKKHYASEIHEQLQRVTSEAASGTQ